MTEQRRRHTFRTWILLSLYLTGITVVPALHAQEVWAEEVHVEAQHDSECTRVHSELGCLVGTATGDSRLPHEPAPNSKAVRKITTPPHTHIRHDAQPTGLINGERGPPLS